MVEIDRYDITNGNKTVYNVDVGYYGAVTQASHLANGDIVMIGM